MTIDRARAAAVRSRRSRSARGCRCEELAWGIHSVVNENMAAAARVHVAERGRQRREFALLVTGGGGPLHGCEVAQRLGIRRVVCPPSAGVASALGPADGAGARRPRAEHRPGFKRYNVGPA